MIGFDIERHVYGQHRYPGQLVLQDVLTLHGSQFRKADCIVASPPCQEFSYMAMPWSRGKQIAAALRGQSEFPEGYTGSRTIAELTALFDACFRIQREASEAAGRHIPMVVENVKGAQPWAGPAKANFGSFYLWGDVGMVGRSVVGVGKKLQMGQFTRTARRNAQKVEGFNFHQHEKNGGPGGSFQSAAVAGIKSPGMNWSDRSETSKGFNVTNAQRYRQMEGVKIGGTGDEYWRKPLEAKRREATAIKNGGDWFSSGENASLQRKQSSRSDSRKAASALIAKIPFELSAYLARYFRP